MEVVAMVAMGERGEIGERGDFPWERKYVRWALDWFNENTMGHAVIMGRKTWDALPGPLKGRHNIVMSRTFQPVSLEESRLGCEYVSGVDAALAAAARLDPGGPAMIVGGAETYGAFLARMDRVLVTLVHREYPWADKYWPAPFREEDWTVRRVGPGFGWWRGQWLVSEFLEIRRRPTPVEA